MRKSSFRRYPERLVLVPRTFLCGGVCFISKQYLYLGMGKITIDTTKWMTQDNYAHEIGVSKQVIGNWIRRNKIEWWSIPELNLRLVRVGSEKKIKK